MRHLKFAAAILALAIPASAQTVQPAPHPLLRQIAGEVSAAELRATDTRLVAFGTRHALSGQQSPSRGIIPAQAWVKARFGEISAACGNCLSIDTPSENFSGARVPTPTPMLDVLAIQKGTSDPNRVIIIAGHLDSRVTDPMNSTSDAPGADDDGSGTSAVIEAARVLSRHKFPATLVFAVLTGEEQGLYGGTVLAHYARDHHWNVEGDLNNDIIGNSLGGDGTVDANHVRIFSEGTQDLASEAQAKGVRYNGGEVDSPARNLARFMVGMADTYQPGFHARMIYRTDRYGRGGDQNPLLAAGFTAVRVTEAAENYTREHQDVRDDNGVRYGDRLEAVDFQYLANVARLNIVTMAALAMAPDLPHPAIKGGVSYDTTLTWAPVAGAAGYSAWWRDSLEPYWTHVRDAGSAAAIKLEKINIDNWLFGVSSISADGYESPVSYPLPEAPAGATITAAPAAK